MRSNPAKENGTDKRYGLDPQQRQMDQKRPARRLQKLKAHHNRCEARYKKARNEVRENMSSLHQKDFMESKQSSDESDDTIILGPTPTEVRDMSVPELTRTDSVILNKQMLGYSEESLSSSDITEEEYVPDSKESESDSLKDSDSSEDIKQLKKRKKRAQKNISSLEVQPLRRIRVATSRSLTTKDPGESSSTDAKDPGESSSFDSKDPGESSSFDSKDPGESSSFDVKVMTLKKKEDGSRVYNKRSLSEAKWNAPQLIPFAEDVRKMHQYLDTKRMECQRNLKEEAVKKNWAELAKITLYVELALSELEKKLCKHFQRIEIKGKRGRKVPILLTPDMASSMELLLQHRRNSLSSTKLRKHMATMSKVLNLKDNEMDDLADFLGHDIRVHRQYYRLPEGTLQLAKISKVLLALERGQLSNFKGKNLDEISIDPQEKMSVDSGSDTEEEVDSAERDAETSSSRSPGGDGNKEEEIGQFGVTRRCTTESSDLPSAIERSDGEEPADMEVSSNSNTSKGPPQKKRVKWNKEEVQAVEKTLMDWIDSGKVPGKAQCMKCIETSCPVLNNRTWQGVKFYVKNRIDALKRETFKRR
ncbi:uncharacterized protein LOC129367697 [Poeciliopsis prolifica]|uniref:uncharacterized protein LOC129367697 n=1 Tax=Poeciliopsis prolifica TaxID=188132 RepID=UPI00241357E4|nr:uncharacterized protein LOC129367697 [Poeciliopsis prolifica]